MMGSGVSRSLFILPGRHAAPEIPSPRRNADVDPLEGLDRHQLMRGSTLRQKAPAPAEPFRLAAPGIDGAFQCRGANGPETTLLYDPSMPPGL
jgi:hypothetical protein